MFPVLMKRLDTFFRRRPAECGAGARRHAANGSAAPGFAKAAPAPSPAARGGPGSSPVSHGAPGSSPVSHGVPSPSPFSNRRGLSLRGLFVALALVFTGAAPACVPQTLYEQSLAEQATLERELARAKRRGKELELGIESLENERAELIERIESLRLDEAALRERGEGLRGRVAALEARSAQLSETLTTREEELEARSAEIVTLRSTYDTLVADLQSEVAKGQVEVERLKGGLKVKLAQAVLFDSGSASLTGAGREVITRVARRLKQGDALLEVQGHSDNQAIRPSSRARYPSNWELAGARAAAVVRVLLEGGVNASRMRAVSYADTQPVADNTTASGRADNRRIEILLRPAASVAGSASAEAPGEGAAPMPDAP